MQAVIQTALDLHLLRARSKITLKLLPAPNADHQAASRIILQKMEHQSPIYAQVIMCSPISQPM
jgi:hypothetical protein